MRKHIAIAVAIAALSIGRAFADTTTTTTTVVNQDLADFLIGAAKFAGAYISSNGISEVGFGLSNMGGKGSLQVNPLAGFAITPIRIGQIGTDAVLLGVEETTYFQPNKNAQMLGVVANWTVWKQSKVGRIFPGLNFSQFQLVLGWDVPVENFGGQGIRLSNEVLHFGGGLKF